MLSDFSSGLPFITLCWGKHPTGFTTVESSKKYGIEKGCALHFSQNIFGYVCCIIYPFESEFHTPSEKYYIHKMYKSPTDITKEELDGALKLMFAFAHTSSFLGNPDMYDKMQFWKLKILSIIKKIGYLEILKPAIKILKDLITSQVIH